MRSAFAEAVFRKIAPERECLSAGVMAWDGNRAEPDARAMAKRLGYSLEAHRSQRVTSEHVAQASVIYIMDSLNEEILFRNHPEAKDKTKYLGELLPAGRLAKGSKEIDDPYLAGDKTLEQCFRRIEEAVGKV
jgi:protein-tyrosine-phosphatase